MVLENLRCEKGNSLFRIYKIIKDVEEYASTLTSETKIDINILKGKVDVVYFLCLEGEIVYVGRSINFTNRLQQHFCEKNFDSFFSFEVKDDLEYWESVFIDCLKPEYNKSGGRSIDCHLDKLYQNLSKFRYYYKKIDEDIQLEPELIAYLVMILDRKYPSFFCYKRGERYCWLYFLFLLDWYFYNKDMDEYLKKHNYKII